jgi:hypothetical protein
MKSSELTIKEIVQSILNSYSQVFFSTSKLLAVFLLLISFFDYGAGIGGLVAVLIANLLAWLARVIINTFWCRDCMVLMRCWWVWESGLFYQPSPELFLANSGCCRYLLFPYALFFRAWSENTDFPFSVYHF